MKKVFLAFFFAIAAVSSSFAITIDGKFWDWSRVPVFHDCVSRPMTKDRGGFDMRTVRMYLGREFLYMMIDGRSVEGLGYDHGEAMRKTSLRVSFSSAQSPLNRVRIAAEAGRLWEIKISVPEESSVTLGGKRDKYWSRGRNGGDYSFELKVPVVRTAGGVRVATAYGPLIKLPPGYSGSRSYLSLVLINTVDMKTHRLVDTTQFVIKPNSI